MKTLVLKSLFIMVVIALITVGCKKKDEVEPTLAVGTGEFTLASTKYSGSCYGVSSSSCTGSTDVIIMSSQVYNLIVYNMPSSTSGTFKISNGWSSATNCGVIYVLATNPKAAGGVSASVNGTLTKTGAKSYTLTASVSDSPSTSASTATTATGSYQ